MCFIRDPQYVLGSLRNSGRVYRPALPVTVPIPNAFFLIYFTCAVRNSSQCHQCLGCKRSFKTSAVNSDVVCFNSSVADASSISTGAQERSDFGLLCKSEGVFNVDAKTRRKSRASITAEVIFLNGGHAIPKRASTRSRFRLDKDGLQPRASAQTPACWLQPTGRAASVLRDLKNALRSHQETRTFGQTGNMADFSPLSTS